MCFARCYARALPKKAEMTERNIVTIWIATGVVIAIVLGSLVLFSDGPLPSIQVDEGPIPPFWGRSAGWMVCQFLLLKNFCEGRL
jgi:hypothetical protein